MLYEILKTSKGASFAPDMYTALWAQKLARDGEVKTLSGDPPLSFQANGQPLLDYLISGNTVQNGTPTPDNPVMPEGTGERTGNLFSCNIEQGTISAEGTLRSADDRVRSDDFIIMETGEYTINALSESGTLSLFVFEYMEDGTFVSRAPVVWTNVPYTFSLTGKRKMKFVFSYSSGNITPTMVNSVMLNVGSIALPYEPYGVKIPISSANTTTTVYLGEVQTMRKIKKLVLTGAETWIKSSAYQGSFYSPTIIGMLSQEYLAYCSHLAFSILSQYGKGKFCFNGGANYKNCNLWFNQFDSNTTVEELISYLSAQYAAGTPVTVWYVLAEPTTGIVNEPLMKIGDYADTLSMEQAGVQIPTARGTNTLDVLTDLKPSEIYIKYKS